MRILPILLVTTLASPALAAEVPEKWLPAMAKAMPREQRIVQTLVADLDDDGKDEWIAIGEPIENAEILCVSAAIFEPAKGGKPPRLIWRQRLRSGGERKDMPRVAGAIVRRISPIGNALILVGGAPDPHGDSRFAMQIYDSFEGRYRPMAPGDPAFRTQGGFAIGNFDPRTPEDEIAIWTWRRGENELLFDRHHYDTFIWRWDGRRFLSPDLVQTTAEKMDTPEDAARSLGVKTGDLRRQIPRVAEVP